MGFLASQNMTPQTASTLLSSAGLLILLLASVRRDNSVREPFSILTLLLLYLTVGFGLGGVYFATAEFTDVRRIVSAHAIATAGYIGLVGALAIVVGMAVVRASAITSISGLTLPKYMRSASHTGAIVLLEATGWLARVELIRQNHYFHITESITVGAGTAVVSYASGLPTLAAYILASRRWHAARRLGLIWLVLLAEVVWYLPTGARSPLIALVLGVFILRARLGFRISRVGVGMSVLLTVFVVFPVVAAYRGTDASYNSAVQSSASSAANSISGLSPRQLLSTGTSETFSRFSDALSVGVVLDESYVDRKRVGGSPIDYVVSSAVPRFIWPSKPNPGTYGNEFGRAYGLIAQKDYVTSISVSQPLHAYMFGGWILLILFCLFSGLMYGLLERLLSSRRNIVIEAVYAYYAFSIATSIGTIWPLGFLGLCKNLLFSLAILWAASVLAGGLSRGRFHRGVVYGGAGWRRV